MKIQTYTRIIFLVLVICSNISLAQNLVLNPSFEQTNVTCGAFSAEGFNNLIDWDRANSNTAGDSCTTPDLFSACNVIFGTNAPTFMPSSALGFQYSRTGTRHAGFITHSQAPFTGCTQMNGDGWREYVQGRTSSPLVAGQTYCVSFFVSLPDQVAWGSNNIGVYFTQNGYYQDACAGTNQISVTPQLNYNCSAIMDTVNWVRLQWNYTATGGERYFVIGNFFNSANTTRQCSNSAAGNTNPFAYYFIDDVSIEAGTCCYAEVNPVVPQCLDGANITLTARPPLGTNCNSTITGTWSGPGIINASAGTFSPSAAGQGTHTVNFTLPCGYVASTQVTVNLCAQLSVCQESNGSLTVSGGTQPYTWQSSTTSTDCSGCLLGQCSPFCPGTQVTTWTTFSSNSTASPPGTFPIRVRDANSNTLTLNSLSGVAACQTTCVLSLSPTSIATTCGQNNGSASVNVTAGTGPYTYSWSNGGSGSSVTNLPAGNYTVTVNSSGGCSQTASVNVASSVGITADATSTSTTCGNSNGAASVNITAGAGPFTYNWSNGGSGSSISNVSAGTYTVTIAGANGCTTTASATVAGSSAIALSTNVTATTCGLSNGSATANTTAGTGPFTYLWSNNATDQTASSLAPGTYTVTVTGAGGCTGTGTATIAASTSITISTSVTNANCGQTNGSATASASGGSGVGFQYVWNTSPAQNGATVTGLAAGNYIVTATDNTGCSATSTVSISNFGAPSASLAASSNPTCFGIANGTASVTASGGVGNLTYTWNTSPIQTGTSATGLSAGTWVCTVTDQNNCQTAVQVTLIEPQEILALSTITPASCGEANGCIALTVSGGTNPIDADWTGGNGNVQGLCNVVSGSYAVTFTDANGCQGSYSYTVPSNGGPTASISNQTNATCYSALNGSATVTATGGISPYSFTWNTFPIQTTATATNLAAGTYSCSVTDQTGCQTMVTVTIFEPTALHTQTTVLNPVCTANNGSIILSPYGGNPGYSFNWCQNLGNQSTVSNLGAGTYCVSIIDATGCSLDTSITLVSSQGNYQVTITSNGSTLSATSGASYQWYWNNEPIAGATGQTYTYSQSGLYYVIATDANGCTDQSNSLELTKTSVDEIYLQAIKVYPIPATDFVFIEGLMPISNELHIDLYSVDGKNVFSETLKSGNQVQFRLPIENLNKGLYLLKLGTDKNSRTIQLMVGINH